MMSSKSKEKRILDTHLGYDYVCEEDFNLKDLLGNMERNKVDLSIILAHSGGSIFASEGALAAQLSPNISLKASWLPGFTVRRFCKILGEIMWQQSLRNSEA